MSHTGGTEIIVTGRSPNADEGDFVTGALQAASKVSGCLSWAKAAPYVDNMCDVGCACVV